MLFLFTTEVKQKLRSNILQRLVKSLSDIDAVSEQSEQAIELLKKAASQEYEFMSETGEHYDQLAKAVVMACGLKEIQEYKRDNYFISPWDFDLFDVSLLFIFFVSSSPSPYPISSGLSAFFVLHDVLTWKPCICFRFNRVPQESSPRDMNLLTKTS